MSRSNPRQPARVRPAGRWLLAVLSCLGAAGALAADYPVASAVPADPRLQALLATPEDARAARMPRFWEELRDLGTPLRTPLPSGATRLTFLWRGQADTRNVRLSWPAQSAHLQAFTPVPGTDAWFLELEVPAATRASYRIAPDVPAGDRSLMRQALIDNAQADPLNPLRWQHASREGKPEVDSLLELPDAPVQRWSSGPPATPAGRIEQHWIESQRLHNRRRLDVYLPPGHSQGRRYPLLLVFDGGAYLHEASLPATLDRLIAAGAIPPLVAVLVDNPSAETRSRELPCNPVFADFMADELLPWLHRRWSLSTDPRQVVLAGSSYGGLAAACTAWRHPKEFGRVLAQSGSFWWGPNAFDPDPAKNDGGWLARQFARSPRSGLAFHLQAGALETRLPGDATDGILESTRTLARTLRARGYRVQLDEYAGGHDFAIWREGIAEGLIDLLGN